MPSPAPADAQFSTARPFSRRKRVLLAGLAFLLVLSLGGPYFYFAMVAESDLGAAIAETDSSDPSWRLLELEAQRRVIPDEENSAINLANAKALLPVQWPIWDYAFAPENQGQLPEDVIIFRDNFENLEPEAQLSGRQIEALRKELQRAAAALAELYKIADKPHGRFPVTYPKDFISYSSSGADDSRHMARLLEYDILLRCQDRNPDAALKSCQCLLHAQGAIGDEPYLISMLARMAIRGRVCKKIERALAQGEPSEAALAAMQHLLEKEATQPLYLTGMRGERGHSDGYLAALQSGDASLQDFRKAFGERESPVEDLQFWLFPGAAKTNRAALLRDNNQIVEFAKLPIEEQRTRLTAAEPDAKKLPWLARNLAVNWRSTALAFHQNVAKVHCTALLLASERFRREHHQLPKRLEELVPACVAKVPGDPFVDARLCLRAVQDGIVIYSVGHDGEDNGGNLANNGVTPGTDVGVRLWDVAKRRQPPKPQVPNP